MTEESTGEQATEILEKIINADSSREEERPRTAIARAMNPDEKKHPLRPVRFSGNKKVPPLSGRIIDGQRVTR